MANTSVYLTYSAESFLILCIKPVVFNAGNPTCAILQEAADMTITPDVKNEQSTFAEAYSGTDVEEKQVETSPMESTAAAGRDDTEKDGEEEEKKKKENLPEESLKMASWVEVSDERLRAEERSEADTRASAEGREPLEAEGRSTAEAEKEQTRSVEAELAVMEEKWREQCVINDTLKQRLADEEGRFRVRQEHTASLLLSFCLSQIVQVINTAANPNKLLHMW